MKSEYIKNFTSQVKNLEDEIYYQDIILLILRAAKDGLNEIAFLHTSLNDRVKDRLIENGYSVKEKIDEINRCYIYTIKW